MSKINTGGGGGSRTKMWIIATINKSIDIIKLLIPITFLGLRSSKLLEKKPN